MPFITPTFKNISEESIQKQDIYTETQVYWRKDIRKSCRANATRTMAFLHT